MTAAQVIFHFNKPWQVLVSVCVTRMNRINKQLIDIENRYATLQNEIEVQRSVLNGCEFQKKKLTLLDQKKVNKLSELEEQEVIEARRELSALQDQEDAWSKDFDEIVVAPCQTKFDNDQTCVQRKLDTILHFVVKDEHLLKEKTFLYPYKILESGETIKTASNCVLSSYGFTNTFFASNVPVGMIKIRFKENEERGQLYQGAKIFFTKTQLHADMSTFVPNEEEAAVHRWLSAAELKEDCNDAYIGRTQKFLS